MIPLQTDADTYEEWVEQEKDDNDGTILEGSYDIYNDHEDFLRFLFENKSDFTPDFFIGTEENLMEEGLDVDDEALFDAVTDAPNLTHVDTMEYVRDRTLFQLGRIKKRTDTWNELKTELAKILQTNTPPEEREEYIENRIKTQQEDQANILREQADKVDEVDPEDSPIIDLLDPDTDKLREQADEIESMDSREYIIFSMEKTIQTVNNTLDVYRFRDEPNEGDYGVFHANPSDSKIKNNEYITEDTQYNVIIKLTNKHETTEHGITKTEFDYEVIAYDDELLDLYPEHFLITNKSRIEPRHQDRMTFYQESPLGQVETKTTTNN